MYIDLILSELHCPRAGPGRVKAIFSGPDPGPQGRATHSLALAPGRLDPGPGGSGQGRVRANPDPWDASSKQKKKIKCGNFDNFWLTFMYSLYSNVNSMALFSS
jgi:hypothetical protein